MTLHKPTLDAADAIRTLAESPGPVLATAVGLLRELIGFENVGAYRASPAGGGAALDFVHSAGMGPERRFAEAFDAFLRVEPGRFALYDHVRPEADQRNVLHTYLPQPEDGRMVRELFPRVGLTGKEQTRVLLCDDESLLAWVGGYRTEPLTADELARFRALIPVLRQRLALERRLELAEARAAAVDVAMEAIGTEAYLVAPNGRLLSANTMGRLSYDRDADGTRELLARTAKSETPGEEWLVNPVRTHEGRSLRLLVRRSAPGDIRTRLVTAAARWELTRRQTEVLGHLVEGRPNKTIADLLSCSVGTVELHVTAILRKSGADSRSSVAALFWSL